MKFHWYNGRYGKCVGIGLIDGGWAIFMEDGSKHFMGNALEWLAVFLSRLFFWIYVIRRNGF